MASMKDFELGWRKVLTQFLALMEHFVNLQSISSIASRKQASELSCE